MRIAAYCRVSTDKEEQLESLANQEEFFGQFASKNGHQLIKIYSDEGISGKQTKNRTQFLKMLKDAECGLFDLVVVKDISRFARNTVDFLIAIRELKSIGIDVQFLSNNQTILGNSEFMLTIFSAMAQEESANLSSRVKFGKKQNAKKGKVPNFVYGYNWIDKFNLSINHEQAEIVRRIYKDYVDKGKGLRRIGIELDKDNIISPAGCQHWGTKSIKRILSNPIYKGTLVSRKSVGVDFISGKRKQLEPEEDFIFQKEEYRIISDEYFSKAAEILKKRAKQYENKNPCNRVTSQYTFSGLIKCENCGHAYTRRISASKEGYIYWKCCGNNTRGSKYCNNNVTIKDNDLVQILKNYFMELVKDPHKIEEAINDIDNKNIDVSRDQIEDKLQKLNKLKEKYLSMYLNEIISIERLKSETADIDKNIKKLNREMEEVDTTENTRNKINLSVYLENFLKNGEFSNIELKKIIENITINKDKKIVINFKKEID